MSADPLTAINTRETPQRTRARADQVQNNAGGYVFSTGDDARVLRFLVLGTTGGTYYVGEREHTADNAEIILAAARERGTWLVEQVVAVSTAGRAPRQQPALFALAAVLGLGDTDAQRAASAALPQVARTASTLFTFLKYATQFRGWGPVLRRAVTRWYLNDTADRLAYQMVKYRQRDGWTHRDVLRSAHPGAKTNRQGVVIEAARKGLFEWATTGAVPNGGGMGLDKKGDEVTVPAIVRAFTRAQAATDVETWVREVDEHRLPWEALPDAARTKPEVWAALVRQGMPITALIRNLPTLTRLGVLDDAEIVRLVAARLADPVLLRKGRVHPLNLLIAQKVYASGRSVKGDTRWNVNRRIVDALDAAFYSSLATVEPTGKRILVGLDVSGSMGAPLMDPGSFSQVGRRQTNYLPLNVREASVAMAMSILSTEENADVVGFTGNGSTSFRDYHRQDTSSLTELDLSARRRLDDNVRAVTGLPFGATDCALPMLWAASKKRQYDAFVIFTDNETWAGGQVQPFQALTRYRQRFVGDAKLVVMGMTATDFTIADPNDPGSLDVVGLDAAAPNFINDFIAGRV
jgi:60 kDa SS-A/Ro ribonucleoprotein